MDDTFIKNAHMKRKKDIHCKALNSYDKPLLINLTYIYASVSPISKAVCLFYKT